MFKIYEIYPLYCPITDAITGAGARLAVANVYETEALAKKIAGKLAQVEYENCGDNDFRVVPADKGPFDRNYPPRPPVAGVTVPADPAFDDMPF